jgi:hypothetical protein
MAAPLAEKRLRRDRARAKLKLGRTIDRGRPPREPHFRLASAASAGDVGMRLAAGEQPTMSEADRQRGAVYYLCKQAHSYTMGAFLGDYPNTVADDVRIVPYERLPSSGRFRPGAFIFSDLERLGPAELSMAQRFYDAIGEQNPGLPRLNDPRSVLPRFEMLRALHEAGLNSFNVHRVPDRYQIEHFPVFIRWGNNNQGMPLTRLIPHANVLEHALVRIAPEIRSHPDLMIVEFGNAPGQDGRYRRYSAYRVGDHIYGQHCRASKDWFSKFAGQDWGEAERAESTRYMAENPHADRLKAYFDVGGVRYGRIDYYTANDRIEVLELTTNPLVVADRRNPDFATYAGLHDTAIRSLIADRPGPHIRLPDDARVDVDAIHAEVLKMRYDPRTARASEPSPA